MSAFYASVEDAAAASVAPAEARIQPVLAELLDEVTRTAIGPPVSAGGGVLLIVQTDGGPDEAAYAVEILGKTAVSLRSTADPGGTAGLLAARREALPAIEQLGRPLIEDIAVPRSRLAEAVRQIGTIADRHRVPIRTLAHAGDGNLHPIIVAGRPGEPIPAAAHRAADDIFGLASAPPR